MTVEERMKKLDLRIDRADVILPAAIVLQKIMKQAGMEEVLIPRVGLKEGVLIDLVDGLYHQKHSAVRNQVWSSALQLGRKYGFEEQHGVAVAKFAVRLFRETRALHNMEDEYCLLLEVAALLHDMGHCVASMGHHKHSCYLLMNSPLIGLTNSQQMIVANTARYHRKSSPSLKHELYKGLLAKEQIVVRKMSALLRIADALDREHESKLSDFKITFKKESEMVIRLEGQGDLLLERWALSKKSKLFEEEFGVKLVVED